MAENERDQLVKKLQEIVPNPDPDSSANDNNDLRKFWIHEFVRHVDTDKLGKKWLKVDKNKLKKVRIGAANRALTKERMLDIFDEFRNPGSCECFCLGKFFVNRPFIRYRRSAIKPNSFNAQPSFSQILISVF